MKGLILKLTFLSLFSSVYGQDTIRSLIFSEFRLGYDYTMYLEITNMGNDPVRLNQFELGNIPPNQLPYNAPPGFYFMLPEKLLQPGESFLICGDYDYLREQYKQGKINFPVQRTKPELVDAADMVIHLPETEPPYAATDSVTPGIWQILNVAYGWTCFYLEQHFENGDSAVVDQVNGVFDNGGYNNYGGNWGYDVAGYSGATYTAVLVRKFSVKTGNPDFANARGIGEDDSEWIVIPLDDQYDIWRKPHWTIGNHVNASLDKNTLESDIIDVDFANKTLTVPWGMRRKDDIMNYFVKKPGIAWQYHLSDSSEDTLSLGAKTGDQLEVIACGDDKERALFQIIVTPPPSDANQVIPVANHDPNGWWKGAITQGILDWPRVTRNKPAMDTITGLNRGIPFATRTDSLLERLEKPPKAKWEFVWVDNHEHTEIKNGDILKVTAENGEVKQYYIEVGDYQPNHNAFLSAITWPDIPESYRGILGWKGDTIPNFSGVTLNYRLSVPADVEGIPALVAKTQDLNAKVQVKRAGNLTGTVDDRTISFIVTAEDDTTSVTYNVELVKEKKQEHIQRYKAEPFLSEFVFWDQWQNSYGEICNPGNQPLDLSNYMMAMQWNTDPPSVIRSRMGEDEWLDRYDKYVPGYKWVDSAQWRITPGILEPDLNVNPIIAPGDVFCFGAIWTDVRAYEAIKIYNYDYEWTIPDQLDVQFYNIPGFLRQYRNPWNERISTDGNPIRKWLFANWYLFKILNDSIKLGLKPANDPNDFKLIENWGMSDGTDWIIAGKKAGMLHNYMRKPDIYQPDPEFEGSFGTDMEDSEWHWTSMDYWTERGVPWPLNMLYVTNNIGQHFFYPPTHYLSTVSSAVYKVSPGYSLSENIRGVTTGTTVAGFLDNIITSDENQTLTVKSSADDSLLAPGDLLNMNDTLIVLSADSTNTTKYILDVTEQGLSSEALLFSTIYPVWVDSEPVTGEEKTEPGSGTLTGMEYGTMLKTVLSNVYISAGASLNVINSNGSYVPLQQLNFDTAFVFTTVHPDIFLEVIAEDGITSTIYQVKPEVSPNDVFILSDVYAVDQGEHLVEFVPRGTTVFTLLKNLVPSFGASIKIIDKLGNERTFGPVYQDDRIVVTSPNGLVQSAYYISMLATQFIPETTYLAYVTSSVYEVDQMELVITGATSSIDVATFYDRINPAMGATVMIVDANGNEKTSGNLEMGDMLKVVSADGKYETVYLIDIGTSADLAEENDITVYPNPTDGNITIAGLKTQDRIRVYSLTGSLIKDLTVKSSVENISLKNHPAGIYMLVIKKENDISGRYRIIKN